MYNEASNLILKLHNTEDWATLVILEHYVNGAIIQWDRIQSDKKALPKPRISEHKKFMLILFLDIHFYFICSDKVQNLIKCFAYSDNDPKLVALWQKLETEFKTFNDARNHLEHIDERIMDKDKKILGHLKGDTYIFGEDSFDISSAGLKILTNAYEKVLDILRSRSKNI